MPKVRVGDIEIFYREDGHGDHVVWIQGLGLDHRGWAFQIPLLSRHFCCLTFDNRDAGQTSRSPGAYTIKTMADDTIGLMDALAIKQAHVVGLSMGGAIAQEIGIHYPARVRRLVLVATYTSGDPRGTDLLNSFVQMRARFAREEYLRAVGPWIYSYQDYLVPGLVESAIKKGVEDPYFLPSKVYARQAEAATTHFTEDRLKQIQAPTLIVAGDDDLLTPMRFARTLHKEIPGARLAVMQGGAHGLIWTRAEEFNHLVLSFLKEA
ncbi:MAG: alpha/beta fold hydrolase [Candidatus Methylomirabilis sp.]